MKDLKSSLIDLKGIQLQYAFEHGVNFGQRTITISEEISESTFRLIDAALSEMEHEAKAKVTLRINSCGGSVYDALAVIGRMKASKCKIVTEAYGAVMSAALLIFVSGEQRKISETSWLMHHSSSYEVAGTHKEIKDLVEQREREEKKWAAIMSKYTTQSAEYWYEKAKDKDFYMTAEQALQLGVADEII